MKQRAITYIIIAGLLWGTSGIFVKFLSPYGISSVQMTAVRGTVSLIAIGVYVLFYDRKLFKIKLSHIPLCIAAGVSMFLTSSCYYRSMQLTSVATSVMLMYTAPIFIITYSVLFMGEKLTKTKVISAICMFVGCGLVSGIVGGIKFNLLGILLGIASGLCYCTYNIVTKFEMMKKINPISATFYCYVFMALVALAVSRPDQIVTVANKNPSIIIMMIALGVFTSALPYFLYTLSLKTLSAGVASTLGVIEPLAATIYSLLLFKEKLGVYQVIGIVLIIGATIALSNKEKSVDAEKMKTSIA